MKQLVEIQSRLKAPKNQFNLFGKFYYRSCEDILEAVKPLLYELNCTLTISDSVIEVGGRIYVEAIATITNADGETEQTAAYAREEEVKKGMDSAQLTGATSSYARKYALNGLLAIDDNKDADTINVGNTATSKPTPTTPPAPPAIKKQTVDEVKSNISQAKSMNELLAIFNNLGSVMQKDKTIVSALSEKRKQLGA